MAAGAGFAPTWPPSKGGVLLIRRPGNEMVEPEVVATSPNRIKSPVPVYCGFSSLHGARGRDASGHWRRSQRRVSSVGLRELLAQGRDWVLQPVLLRQDRFTKAIHRLLHGGKMVAVSGAAPDTTSL